MSALTVKVSKFITASVASFFISSSLSEATDCARELGDKKMWENSLRHASKAVSFWDTFSSAVSRYSMLHVYRAKHWFSGHCEHTDSACFKHTIVDWSSARKNKHARLRIMLKSIYQNKNKFQQ